MVLNVCQVYLYREDETLQRSYLFNGVGCPGCENSSILNNQYEYESITRLGLDPIDCKYSGFLKSVIY